MVDVFVSYAREDQAFAHRIAQAAAREGYDVWWDNDLPPHLSYGEVITEKIGNAKAAIVVWSHRSAESEWVRAEADLARSQKKLIQTSIDDRLPPMPFNQIQFASIGDWNGEANHPGWNKVRASLAALCGGAAVTDRTAPAVSSPPVTQPPAPASRAGSNNRVLAISLGGLLLAAAAGGGWYMLRDGSSADSGATDDAPAANGVSGTATPSSAPQPASAAFTLAATIDSPDGFMNVRSGPSSGFPVVARVNRGEVFTTYQQDGDWWQVRTADSRVGYMSSRNIRLIDPDAGAVTADAAAEATAEADVEPAAAVPEQAVQVADRAAPAQVFPDSSRRRLTRAEVASLSPARIRLARNEIFARHGRIFQDAQLRRHFERYPWYRPTASPTPLNAIEQANVRLLRQAD